MTSDYGSQKMLTWVFRVLQPVVESDVATSDSLRLAAESLSPTDPSKLKELDQIAWGLWCCGPVSDQFARKSVCRFTWAAMAHICYEQNHQFDSIAALEFSGKTDDQFEFIYRQAASAMNLAFDLELDQDRTHQQNFAQAFSQEIERLKDDA